jgi:hypothetical protein
MKPRTLPLLLLAFAVATPIFSDELDTSIENGLQFAQAQADYMAAVLRLNSRFTEYSNTSGVWQIKSRSTWCSGFTPGLFWYLYNLTGEQKWLDRARSWTEGVRARATEADNDTGFQIYCSFGLGYILTGETDTDYLDVMKTAANTFATQRYNPTIGSYRAWTNTSSNPVASPSITASTTNPNDMVFEVNIDMMMNMELPLYVGMNGGNPDYVDYAVAHADRSWENLVRVDGSTFHVVGYKADGTVDYKRTHQGWKTDSTWSRGQAWAVYGYAMVYRYTGLQRMLQRSELLFDYFMAATAAQTDDFIPYSDFDAPLDASNSRDTSAAAIVASAALELYNMTEDEKYLDAARNILLSLGSPTYLAQGTDYQPILLKASSKWGDPEVGASFADYYYVEAMMRYRALFPPTGDDPLIGGSPVEGQEDWYLSDWFGTYNTTYAPWIYHAQHGWIYRGPTSTNAESYFYDDAMAAWWYTNETDYPSLYLFDPPADLGGTNIDSEWLWYFEETATPRSFSVLAGASTGSFLFFNP